MGVVDENRDGGDSEEVVVRGEGAAGGGSSRVDGGFPISPGGSAETRVQKRQFRLVASCSFWGVEAGQGGPRRALCSLRPAEASSRALVFFGIQSAIEVASALIVLWRFRKVAKPGEERSTERNAADLR